jgi:hypothetical protein
MDSFFSGEVTQLFSDIYCGVELCKIPFNVATVRFVIHFIMILLSGLYVLVLHNQYAFSTIWN